MVLIRRGDDWPSGSIFKLSRQMAKVHYHGVAFLELESDTTVWRVSRRLRNPSIAAITLRLALYQHLFLDSFPWNLQRNLRDQKKKLAEEEAP
jgi:hypothetical protein